MKISRYIFFLVVLFALPLAAQVNDTYVVPVSGNLPGAFGTRWMTQLSIFNPHASSHPSDTYKLTVSITFLPTAGGQGIEKLVDIPPNAVAIWDNVLDQVFHTSGSGALLVAVFPEDNPGVANDALSRSILVNSDTFNNASSGTYGQTIPGTWIGLQDVQVDGVTAIAHGIRNLQSQGWRANIGATNLGRCKVTVFTTVYDFDGHAVSSPIPFDVPPQSHFQEGLPVQVDRGSIEFSVDDPCANDPNRQAVVFPYVSVVDQLSGDPTYQSPTLLASARFLYGKGAVTSTPTSLLTPGKRIDVDFARGVRATALRLGTTAFHSDALLR